MPSHPLLVRLPYYSAFLTIALSLIALLAIFPYQLDDAYITYRYAQNLLEHGIFSFNVGEANVEGFSSPIWLVLSALTGYLLGLAHIHLTGIIWGSISFLALVLLPLLSHNHPHRLATCCFLALTPTLLLYAGTGLETVFFALLVITFALALVGKLSIAFGVVAVILAPWTRPEAPWLMVMLAITVVLSNNKKAIVKPALIYAAGFVLSLIILLIARNVLFDDVLPNTFYEKKASFAAGWQYLFDALSVPWFVALLIMAAVSLAGKNRAQRNVFFMAVSWLIVAVIEGGDWMPNHRFMAPALVLLVLAIDSAYLSKGKQKWLFIALITVFCVSGVTTLRKSINHSNNHEVMVTVEDMWLVEWIRKNPFNTVALLDIGLIGYHITQNIVDLGGLTDSYISRLEGLHMEKTIPFSYIKTRNPDVVIIRLSEKPQSAELNTGIILSPVEANLVADEQFQSVIPPYFKGFRSRIRPPRPISV